jgi:ABC-2 type transport system permease protein
MVKFVLFIVRLFRKPIQWLGVDFFQFEILLGTKLTMDFRSSPTAFHSSSDKKRSFLYQLLMYSIFGLLFGVAAFSIGDLALSLTIFFSVIMVSLTMTLITEFTTVLFDQRDNYILLPRPVSNRTLLLLRLVHIQFYIGFIAVSLALATGIMVAVKYSFITVIFYTIAVGLSIWITLIFTTFIYLMLSKVINGERFKDLISYAQIIMAVVIFGSYQLVPRLIDATILKNVSMSVSWWTYFLPPAWLAFFVKLSLFKGYTKPVLIMSILAIIVPITGALILIRSMSKGFGNILSEGSAESISSQTRGPLKTRLSGKIKNLFCISEIEKAGWNFTMATTGRDRKFKQAVYPFFGMMIVFAFVILKPDLSDLIASLQDKAGYTKYFFIVICGFSGNAAVMQLPYTDTPEAAWIYKALPLRDYGHLHTGVLKAILFRFFIPVYLIIAIPSILIWELSIIPQIFLSALGNVFIILISLILRKMELPFTQAREMQQKGTNSIIAILSMVFMFMIAGVVYSTSFLQGWLTCLICVIVVILIILMFRFIRKSWISPKGWVTLRSF